MDSVCSRPCIEELDPALHTCEMLSVFISTYTLALDIQLFMKSIDSVTALAKEAWFDTDVA